MPCHPFSPPSISHPPWGNWVRQPASLSHSPLNDDADDGDEKGDDIQTLGTGLGSASSVSGCKRGTNSPNSACQARTCFLLSYPQNLKWPFLAPVPALRNGKEAAEVQQTSSWTGTRQICQVQIPTLLPAVWHRACCFASLSLHFSVRDMLILSTS